MTPHQSRASDLAPLLADWPDADEVTVRQVERLRARLSEIPEGRLRPIAAAALELADQALSLLLVAALDARALSGRELADRIAAARLILLGGAKMQTALDNALSAQVVANVVIEVLQRNEPLFHRRPEAELPVTIMTARELEKILPKAPNLKLVREALNVINHTKRHAGCRSKWTVVVGLLKSANVRISDEDTLEELRRRYRRSP